MRTWWSCNGWSRTMSEERIMVAVQEFTGTLVAISCGACGVAFGIPQSMYDERRRDHETFWCPNGHPRAYKGASTEEQLRRDLKFARAARTAAEDQARTAEYRR